MFGSVERNGWVGGRGDGVRPVFGVRFEDVLTVLRTQVRYAWLYVERGVGGAIAVPSFWAFWRARKPILLRFECRFPAGIRH